MVINTNSLTASNSKTTIITIKEIATSCFVEKRVYMYVYCENMPVYLSQLEKSTPNR